MLWLWCRQATTALIQPLAWEAPYAVGVALKRQNFFFFEKRKEKKLLNFSRNKICQRYVFVCFWDYQMFLWGTLFFWFQVDTGGKILDIEYLALYKLVIFGCV